MAKKHFLRGMEFGTEAIELAVLSGIMKTKRNRNEWSPDWGKECVKEWKPLDEWITKLKRLSKKGWRRLETRSNLFWPIVMKAWSLTLINFKRSLSVARLYTHRRIMRPDELSIVRHRSRRTSQDRSLLSMHNASCTRLHTRNASPDEPKMFAQVHSLGLYVVSVKITIEFLVFLGTSR